MMLSNRFHKVVSRRIEAEKEEIIQFLRELVQTPSITGNEGMAQKLVEAKFKKIGLDVDVFEPDMEALIGHPAYFKTTSYERIGYKDRPNVVGSLKGIGGGRSLILNGHIDVVSPEPLLAWRFDPWSAEIHEGKMYGRGSCDMKCGIAAMTYAVKSIMDEKLKLRGDVLLETTIEEEDGGVGGVLSTLLRGYTADAAIITESTGLRSIGIAGAGIMYFRVKIIGKTAHAASAHLGVNAIGKAMKIFEALEELNGLRQSRIRYHPAEINPLMKGHITTLNVGTFQAGNWPSTVPGFAQMECRIGWPPGEELEEVKREVEETIIRVSSHDPWLRENPPEVEWFGWKAWPHEQDVNHPIVKTVTTVVKEMTGNDVVFAGGSGGCDARFYVLNGGVPAINFGANGGDMHSANEFVEIDSVIQLTKILSMSILEWCGFQE